MDPSSYGHHHHQNHHTRYIPFSSPPPPPHPHPPPPHYQQSPSNLYSSRHYLSPPQPPLQLLPPPPSPPIQPQPYRPLPSPPLSVPLEQYPNHHPQFNLNPNLNSKPGPTYVPHQFEDFPQRRVLDTRPDYWPDNRVSSRPVSHLNREFLYHQFDRRPASPELDRFRHDLEGNSRFRDLELNQREREELGRVHSDRWIRNFGNASMEFKPSSNNLNLCDHGVADNVRRGSRLHDQLIDSGNNEIDERDDRRVFPRIIDYRYGSETERFTDRGSSREEASRELDRTPRRKIQKKSALLRIQKVTPNRRNREDERSHYSGYCDEGNTSTFRRKDLSLNLDHDMEEKEREGSPVELDVSFKSNSLVAKAIATPSSAAPISDSNVTPRNTKLRRVMVFDNDCSSLQHNQSSETGGKLDGSASAVSIGSGYEVSKKSEEKVEISGTGNVQDGTTRPCSKETNVSLRKGKFPKVTLKLADSSCASVTESDKKPDPLEGKATVPYSSIMVDGHAQTCYDRAHTTVGEDKVIGTLKSTVSDKNGASISKLSSFKATKKKKIVRKVVKKVMNSPLNLANSDAAHTSVTPLKMTAAMGSVDDVVSKCCLKESAVLLEDEKVNGASKGVVSREVDTDVDPGSSVAPKIKRNWNSLTPSSSLSHEENKVDQSFVNADNSGYGLHIISNIKEDCTETPNESITSGTRNVEDVNKQFYHNGSNINYGLSGSEDTSVHGNIVDIGSSSVAMPCSIFDDCSSSNTKKINIACDIDNVNSGNKQVSGTPGSLVVEDCTNGGLPEANCSVGSNKMPDLPCSVGTQINSDSIPADCSNHDRSTICTADIAYVNPGKSNREIGNDLVKHLSPSTLSLGNSVTEGIPNGVESLECKNEYGINVHKRKVGIDAIDLTSTVFTDISLGSTDCLETAISTSGINSNLAEAVVCGIDIGLQHSRDKASSLHQSSSNDTFPKVSSATDGKSPKNKKRKIASSSSSVTSSAISQEVVVSDIVESTVQLPSVYTGDLLQLEQQAKDFSIDGQHTGGVDLLLANNSVVGPSLAFGYLRDAYGDDHPIIDPSSAFTESVAPSSPCLNPLKLGGEQLSTAMLVSSVNNHQLDDMGAEGDGRVKVHVDTAEDPKVISSEATQYRFTSGRKSVDLGQRLPGTDVADGSLLPQKDGLPSASNSLVFGINSNEIFLTNSNGEAMPALDMNSDLGSSNNHDNLVLSTSTFKLPFCQNSEEKAYGDERLSDCKPMIEGACNTSAIVSYSQHGKTIFKSNDAIQTNQSVAGKAGLLPSHDSKNSNSPNFIAGEAHVWKNQISHFVPKSYPTRSSFVFSASKNTTSSTKITKPRTWHRTDNSSATLLSGNKPSLSANPLQRQMPKKSAFFQSTSYIRKGNSLVRKPVSVPALPQGSHSLSSSVYQLNSGVADEFKKGTGPNSRADALDLRTGGAKTSFDRPTTPPLSRVTKVPNRTSNLSGECTSSPLAEPCTSDCCETTTDHPSCIEINDLLNSPEEELKTSETLSRNGSVNNLENWSEHNEGDLVPSNAKRFTYLKPKSNKLIATSDCSRAPILNANKSQTFSASSDGYYKKNKNQLVRTALESHFKQAVSMSDDKSKSVGHMAAKVISSRTFGKRRSNKVLAETHKHSKFSRVWTLHGARLLNNDSNSLRHLKTLPQLFPWKRMMYKRSFKLNSVSSYNYHLSTIGRKMVLSRKRNTVYTRSINGFSIRKSKVLSLGGSSLKWSQSIERHSRKANEEATLAVAEAERKKREQKVSGTSKRSHSSHKVVHGTELWPGERIFRVGSVRYKMDSSRRSLLRISGGESSCPGDHLSENSTKVSYVPKRLVIGNDEYVRIGNGNQLVRDPKKRTRVLASEKVRWSLHTARLRLVKKRKYCQFFTRFGKCNKDDGKCPYIHDSSKIAVCTKFLKGLCSDPNCKLTHEVIPERMPDCSYFLQGLCTNENCPYRHVHVNPNASTCGGFLKGYCADGNECRKKHSYVCPDFEAKGSCSQGSKCKLHHPKNQSKRKKSKRMEHNYAHGRYFGVDIFEPKRMVSERHRAIDDDDIFFDGKFSDYINLDVSDDEAGELHHAMRDQMTFSDNDSTDLQLDDLDGLIKPIRVMN